jgi:hypothetical protein
VSLVGQAYGVVMKGIRGQQAMYLNRDLAQHIMRTAHVHPA